MAPSVPKLGRCNDLIETSFFGIFETRTILVQKKLFMNWFWLVFLCRYNDISLPYFSRWVFLYSTRKANQYLILSFFKNSFYSTCRTLSSVSRSNGLYDGWTGTYDAKTARRSGLSPRLCTLSPSRILWTSFVIII